MIELDDCLVLELVDVRGRLDEVLEDVSKDVDVPEVEVVVRVVLAVGDVAVGPGVGVLCEVDGGLVELSVGSSV